MVASTLEGQEKKQAMVKLLEQETKLLRQLQEHKSFKLARRRAAAVNAFLDEVSRAQIWKISGGNGGSVEVETPETKPVRTLASITYSLQTDSDLTSRKHHLDMLCATLQQFKPVRGDPKMLASTAAELLTLAMRGIQLIERGTPDSKLRGLRKRLQTLLVHYLHQAQGRPSPVAHPRIVRAAGAKPLLSHSRK